MLGDITAADEIYIVTGRTDMRKSIDGLCAIVEDQLHMDPRRSALYLFCGKRCDRIKALLWESDGFVLLAVNSSKKICSCLLISQNLCFRRLIYEKAEDSFDFYEIS